MSLPRHVTRDEVQRQRAGSYALREGQPASYSSSPVNPRVPGSATILLRSLEDPARGSSMLGLVLRPGKAAGLREVSADGVLGLGHAQTSFVATKCRTSVEWEEHAARPFSRRRLGACVCHSEPGGL